MGYLKKKGRKKIENTNRIIFIRRRHNLSKMAQQETFSKMLDNIEKVLKDNDLYSDENRDKISFYLERFYSIAYFNYDKKNPNFYAYDAELKSIPICNESEYEFVLRKLIMVSLQYIFNIFHNKIDPNRESIKSYLIEDYKYINQTDDFDKEVCKEFKEKIINLMNKMIKSKKKDNFSKNSYVCRFFNTSNGCRNGDKCNFTHLRENKPYLEGKDL